MGVILKNYYVKNQRFFSKYELLRRIRELILVTDLAQQPGFIRSANQKLEKRESLSQSETLKLVLKCADISNEVRPPEISQPIIDSLYEEMFLQGRLEKAKNLPLSPSFDEETVSKEEQQKKFHSHFTLPLFRLLSKAFPATKTPYLDILEEVAQKDTVKKLDLNPTVGMSVARSYGFEIDFVRNPLSGSAA